MAREDIIEQDSPAEITVNATITSGVLIERAKLEKYGSANSLTLTKSDQDTDTDVFLDGNPARRFNIPTGVAGLQVKPSDGYFNSVSIKNNHATTNAKYKATIQWVKVRSG